MSEVQENLSDSLRQLLALELEAAQQTEISELPEGLPAVDLQTLFAEMAALKSEVRAETVASREQREQLQSVLQTMEGSLAQAQQREESLQQDMEELRERLTGQLIDAWIDALERVERSYEKAKEMARPKRRWWRTVTDPAAVSLAEGLELTQRHILTQLNALGIQRIHTVGHPFDPQKMEAMDIANDPGQEDGIVVEELIAGYTDSQGIKRIAQVVVNRKKGNA